MPSYRLLISFLLAAALAACGSDDNGKPPGTGGSGGSGGTGGSGGSGGSGGTGGTVTDACGAGVRILEFDAAAGVLEGSLDGTDHRFGSCSPVDTVGNDVVVHYTAVEAGYHRFSTVGTTFDTLIYALRDCMDGFSEAACNDNTGGNKQSQILVDLQAGEEIFVVVDSVGVRQASPFVLRAELVEPQAPAIEASEGFANLNLSPPTSAFRVSGTNPDGALSGIQVQFFHGDAERTPYFTSNITGLFADVEAFFAQYGWAYINVTEVDGTFTVEAAFSLTADGRAVPAAAEMEIALLDENDFVSEVVTIATGAPPVLEHGDACDERRALNECPASDACVTRAPATEPFCVIATPPTITTADVTVNLDTDRLGIIVTGSDPEADVLYASVLPRNAAGGALGMGGPGASLLPYHQAGHDESGNFRGVVSFPAIFNGVCLQPAQDAFDTCFERCTTQACADACYANAIAQLEQCYLDTLEDVATVEVALADATGRVSNVIVATVTAAPAVDEGGVCDPYGAVGSCPADQICWSDDAYVAETCHLEGPACPADFGVVDLMDHASGSEWVFRGDTREGEIYGAASCGGGGTSEIFSFTAPASGSFSIATDSLGSGVDTVVSVRSYCQLPAYELGCNDNAPFSAGKSRLSQALTAGETVYIVVDSADDLSGGPYTLTVKKF